MLTGCGSRWPPILPGSRALPGTTPTPICAAIWPGAPSADWTPSWPGARIVVHPVDAGGPPEPFLERLIGAALKVRATQPDATRSGGASRSAADSCRAAGSETPADQQLRADGGHPLHLPQYGEDPSAVDLPEAGGVLAVRSD